jgi:hypothetical protein
VNFGNQKSGIGNRESEIRKDSLKTLFTDFRFQIPDSYIILFRFVKNANNASVKSPSVSIAS